jgi:hypothetical protein
VVSVRASWQEWPDRAEEAPPAIGARKPLPPTGPPPANVLAEASTRSSSSGGDLHQEARVVAVVAVSGVTLRCGSCQ